MSNNGGGYISRTERDGMPDDVDFSNPNWLTERLLQQITDLNQQMLRELKDINILLRKLSDRIITEIDRPDIRQDPVKEYSNEDGTWEEYEIIGSDDDR